MTESAQIETHSVLVQCLLDGEGDPPELVAAGVMEEIARDCERVRASLRGPMTCRGRVGAARVEGSLVSHVYGARCAVSGDVPRGQALLEFCLTVSVHGLCRSATRGLVTDALGRSLSGRRGVQLVESSFHPHPMHDE